MLRDFSEVVGWLDRQPRSSLWTTSVTVFEIQFGLNLMTAGKKQVTLAPDMEFFLDRIERRIAPFDEAAARRAGELMASLQKSGTPRDVRDTMIAGIVLAHRASLATRNAHHFSDIAATVINPWSTESLLTGVVF